MVQTTAKGYPYPETSDSPHGPDQLQNLASRADELTDAARMTVTERDALAAPDLYDGRVVMIVDSAGVWQRAEIYHADDPADPDLGGTWHIIVDRASADDRYANLTGDTFTGLVTVDGSGIHPTLGNDFALEGAAPSNYPSGYSTFRDAQGSFPAGTGGVVETFNPRGAAEARQLNWDNGSHTIWSRVSTDETAWEPWLRVNHVPIARIYKSTSNQTVPTGTKTKVSFDAIDFDRDGVADLSNNRLIVPDGFILVIGNAHFAGSSNGNLRNVVVERNASAMHTTQLGPAGTEDTVVNGSTIVGAGEGDPIELFAKQDSGGDLDVKSVRHTTYLAAFYLEER